MLILLGNRVLGRLGQGSMIVTTNLLRFGNYNKSFSVFGLFKLAKT